MSKQKLFVLLTLALIAVIIGSSFFVTQLTRRNLSHQLIERYSNQGSVFAHETANILQIEVNNLTDKLNLIALNSEVKNGNTAACQAKLEETFKVLGSKVGNIGRVNKDGLFQCSLNKQLIGVKAETLGSYIKDIFVDEQHRPVLSRTIKPAGSTSFIQAVHVPVFNNNNVFIGTIGGAIYFDQLEEKLLGGIKLTENGTIVMLDDDGTIIYHQNPNLRGKKIDSSEVQALSQTRDAHKTMYQRAMEGEIGTSRYVFEGVDKVAAFEPFEVIPGRKWIAIVTVPIEDIQATINHSGINTLFWTLIVTQGVIVILASLLFMVFLIRQFSKIDKAKDEFISIASHQLRTPLTAIRLYSEILSNDPNAQKDPILKENVSIIQESTLRMIKLVGDILNVSRIQLGSLKVDPKPTPLEPLIKNIVDEITPTADLKKVNLTIKLPRTKLAVLNIDESLIRQVIHNLLTNAIRYTDSNTGKIIISAENFEGGVKISVSDNGIGIPKEAQGKIFSRFFRAENAVKFNGDGTGLGMYMAKMIMDLARGSINFVSQQDKGTTFTITIPKDGMIKSQGTKSLS